MVQAAFNTRFTKTTWKQLCAIRAIIMALQLKADPSSVRWQLTPGWWLPFRWKIRFPATEWVSGPSALLLHRQGYYNTRAHLLHCYNQHCTTQTRLLHRDTLHCSVPRCFHPLHHCTEDFKCNPCDLQIWTCTWRNSECYIKHFTVRTEQRFCTESAPLQCRVSGT